MKKLQKSKKLLFAVLLASLFVLSACGGPDKPANQADNQSNANQNQNQDAVEPGAAQPVFISGMGCSDPTCTDATHHHDCPADCTDYEHHHNCGLDCTDPQHQHPETETHHEDTSHSTVTPAESTSPGIPAAPTNSTPVQQPTVTTVAFISGMGCSDPNCTDATHHHDCPADCTDYDHHHNCGLDCTDASHHHADSHHDTAAAATTIAFISGMGCSDPNCTDASHHHDCPADCTDYSHYHNCALDCTDANHHHAGTVNTVVSSGTTSSGQHHGESHGSSHH